MDANRTAGFADILVRRVVSIAEESDGFFLRPVTGSDFLDKVTVLLPGNYGYFTEAKSRIFSLSDV